MESNWPRALGFLIQLTASTAPGNAIHHARKHEHVPLTKGGLQQATLQGEFASAFGARMIAASVVMLRQSMSEPTTQFNSIIHYGKERTVLIDPSA